MINFAGGWLGFQKQLSAEGEGALRLAWHDTLLRRFGAGFRGPTLWLYAEDDPFYSPVITKQFHTAFVAGGGRADYRMIANHGLENGHLLIQESPLWSALVDFLLSAKTGRGPSLPPETGPLDKAGSRQ